MTAAISSNVAAIPLDAWRIRVACDVGCRDRVFGTHLNSIFKTNGTILERCAAMYPGAI